jgi:hypothetical protein
MARYLIQDHRFLDSFLTLLGAVLASADTFAAKLRFARFIGMVSGEENTYFLRAFEALGVTEDRRAADPDTQPTASGPTRSNSARRKSTKPRKSGLSCSVIHPACTKAVVVIRVPPTPVAVMAAAVIRAAVVAITVARPCPQR